MDSISRIGPFPLSDPPVRVGWYCVQTDLGEACYYWDGSGWCEEDDPLSYNINFSTGQWYGQAAPSGGDMRRIEAALINVELELDLEQDDGLEAA